MILFSIEIVSIDVIALGVLVSLIVTGLLPLETAFAGFGNETIILIVGLLILTAALVRTGVVELISKQLQDRVGNHQTRLLGLVMLVVAGLSSFMSNTAATALLIPAVMGLAKKMKLSSSKLLMPMAFAAILASSITLVGTSTNIVVSGMLTRYGLEPISMFELTPVGIPILLVGLFYMLIIGRRLIPERGSPSVLTEEYGLWSYITEIQILPDSPLVGATLASSGWGRDFDLTVLVIVRGKQRFIAPSADFTLRAGDSLLVEGNRDDILNIKDTTGIEINLGAKPSDVDLQAEETELIEGIILLRSPLLGRTLRGLGLRDRYKVQVLAIHRHEGMILRKLREIPFRLGDVLLMQGSRDDIDDMERNNIIRVLGRVENQRPNTRRSGIAIAIFVGVIGLAALKLVSLAVAILIGTVLVFLTRCITPEEAYREVEWKLVILIGSMFAFGYAMEYTGTASWLAKTLVALIGDSNPLWLLSGFFGLTLLLTQPMSNQAAALVVLPVAMQSAMLLGLNPRTFAIMIALGASTSFITPLEPACLMIYGLGRYRFTDFIRVGSLLTFFIYLIAIFLVPKMWPL